MTTQTLNRPGRFDVKLATTLHILVADSVCLTELTEGPLRMIRGEVGAKRHPYRPFWPLDGGLFSCFDANLLLPRSPTANRAVMKGSRRRPQLNARPLQDFIAPIDLTLVLGAVVFVQVNERNDEVEKIEVKLVENVVAGFSSDVWQLPQTSGSLVFATSKPERRPVRVNSVLQVAGLRTELGASCGNPYIVHIVQNNARRPVDLSHVGSATVARAGLAASVRAASVRSAKRELALVTFVIAIGPPPGRPL